MVSTLSTLTLLKPATVGPASGSSLQAIRSHQAAIALPFFLFLLFDLSLCSKCGVRRSLIALSPDAQDRHTQRA